MYTQCSNCETVFKLSAEVLRAAGGQVRCGRCGEVFNALARLAEDASVFETRETPLELEQRADSILETVTAPRMPDKEEDSDARAMDLARLQILDFDMSDLSEATSTAPPSGPPPAKPLATPAAPPAPVSKAPPKAAPPPVPASAVDSNETSMEFTLPPGELDRIFVESKAGVPPPFALGMPSPPKRAPPEPVSAKSAAVRPAAPKPPPAPVAPNAFVPPKPVAPAPPEDDGGPLPDIEVVRDNRASSSALSGGFISDQARRQMLDSVDPAEFDLASNRPSRMGGSFALWLGLAVFFALTLAGQLVHRNREWLAAHGPLAPVVRQLYSSLGAPVAAPANLAVYQLRQWGVTGDPAAGSTLKVRASIMNTSSQLVAFPLLRLTLANRYGSSLGARDFEPSEYLGKPTARLLNPGERVDATLQIVDPGKDAEGFEIDVCLRGADRRIVCASDVATPQSKS